MKSFLFVVSTLRLGHHWKRRACITEILLHIIARGVLANTDNLEPLVFIFVIKLRRDGGFVAPVATPWCEIDDHHQLLACYQRTQIVSFVRSEVRQRPIFIIHRLLNKWRILATSLGHSEKG